MVNMYKWGKVPTVMQVSEAVKLDKKMARKELSQ